MNDKPQKLKACVEQASLEATIENQAMVIKACDIKITELKSQVNVTRKALSDALTGSPILKEAAADLLYETPEQCLNDYRNAIIDICVEATKHAQGNAKFFAEIMQGLKR